MQIQSVRILRGPNIYSYRPVARVKLDIGRYESIPSCDIPGFTERLISLLPGLSEHHCSRGYAGGFVERLREGTYLAHIFEHAALELQTAAGYESRFGKTRSAGRSGVYDVVFGFVSEYAATQAAYAAEKLLKAILDGQDINIKELIQDVRKAGEEREMGPSTAAIAAAAQKRNIPIIRLGEDNLLQLGYGRHQQRIWATTTSRTGALATDLAGDKRLTNKILAENGFPVPYGIVVQSPQEAAQAMARVGGNAVLKPINGNQGKGVTLGVHTPQEAERAFSVAAQYDPQVLVEEYIPGRQYRICVINGVMAAAAERFPALVVGDGIHTVAQLIEEVNRNPLRGEGHEKPLTKIKIDPVAVLALAKQQLTPDAAPEKGRVVYVRENANISTGGTAVDVTDCIHPDNVHLIERAVRVIGLDVAGVDIVAKDISQPMVGSGGAIIEINAAPGIRMHHYPSAGQPRDVAGKIVDYLFPDGSNGRIPIIAVTGTNGKTTTTRMIGHIWQMAGYKVGMTTTDGIYINGRCVQAGDTTGPTSASIVLSDPTVEVAVLETARGGLVRGGLAFDASDVGVVTNITEDHFGQDGIEDLEDLAYIKSLILETVKPEGFALLNADDPYVAGMAPRVKAERIYFSIEPNNVLIRRHLGVGGRAFFVKDNMIYAASGCLARPIVRVSDIPVTFGGIAMHNVQNAVIAAAVCYCLKVPVSYIRSGLSSFEENPGRLTLVPLNDFRVCVDYGHNPAGYQALISTIQRMDAKRLVGVIAAPGDRRDDVIVNVGRIAGRGFNRIYIKEDSDLRGRQPGETAKLLRQGVLETCLSPADVATILPEREAVRTALTDALPGDLVVVFYEKYGDVMAELQKFPRTEVPVAEGIPTMVAGAEAR